MLVELGALGVELGVLVLDGLDEDLTGLHPVRAEVAELGQALGGDRVLLGPRCGRRR